MPPEGAEDRTGSWQGTQKGVRSSNAGQRLRRPEPVPGSSHGVPVLSPRGPGLRSARVAHCSLLCQTPTRRPRRVRPRRALFSVCPPHASEHLGDAMGWRKGPTMSSSSLHPPLFPDVVGVQPPPPPPGPPSGAPLEGCRPASSPTRRPGPRGCDIQFPVSAVLPELRSRKDGRRASWDGPCPWDGSGPWDGSRPFRKWPWVGGRPAGAHPPGNGGGWRTDGLGACGGALILPPAGAQKPPEAPPRGTGAGGWVSHHYPQTHPGSIRTLEAQAGHCPGFGGWPGPCYGEERDPCVETGSPATRRP